MSECEECAFLRNQVDELENDVLTAWRVRNAALKVAASFVLPGPDGQDYIDRDRLVREWVEQGHDEVAADDAQRFALMREVIELRQRAAVSLPVEEQQ